MVNEYMNKEFTKYFDKFEQISHYFVNNNPNPIRSELRRKVGIMKHHYNYGHYDLPLKMISDVYSWSKVRLDEKSQEYANCDLSKEKIQELNSISGKLEKIIKKQHSFNDIKVNLTNLE